MIDAESVFDAVRLRVADPSTELVLVALFDNEWIDVTDQEGVSELDRVDLL